MEISSSSYNNMFLIIIYCEILEVQKNFGKIKFYVKLKAVTPCPLNF
jgi:hypothetical protein